MKSKSRWIWVAIISALIAAATTAVIFALRARAKKRAIFERDSLDFDCDECQTFEFDDNGELIDSPAEEPATV